MKIYILNEKMFNSLIKGIHTNISIISIVNSLVEDNGIVQQWQATANGMDIVSVRPQMTKYLRWNAAFEAVITASVSSSLWICAIAQM